MYTVETARGVLRTIEAVGFSLFIILVLNPGELGKQIIGIFAIGIIISLGLFVGLAYYFAHRCHLVTASELIERKYYFKRQEIIRKAHRAPDPIDRNSILRNIQREFRWAVLKKMQDRKMRIRW